MALISIVEYMHDLKEAGFTDKQSEVQARRLELVIANVKSELKQEIKQEFSVDDLVRKQDLDFASEVIRKDLGLSIEKVRTDLELSIEKLRYEMLKFTIWTGVAVVMAMAGMLAKGFHWF
jgi:hypothetical protein